MPILLFPDMVLLVMAGEEEDSQSMPILLFPDMVLLVMDGSAPFFAQYSNTITIRPIGYTGCPSNSKPRDSAIIRTIAIKGYRTAIY